MDTTYLTDILVPDTADLLDVGGTLGDTLQGVTGELELILDVGGGDNLNTGLGSHAADILLTQEVTGKPRQYDHRGDRRAVIPYRISSSARSVSLFFSMLTLMGK